MSDNPTPDNPQPITTEMIATAEKLGGLEFTEEERDLMLDSVNSRVQQYASLRSIDLPNHISPALHFDPRVQHDVPENIPRTYIMSEQPEFTRPDNLEDLAFAPITQLAALIKSKQVSSVELTQMYLSRLKKYDPVLECVVTLTEDLAMAQANRADDELAEGIYRSPLHGIPWGAKDLLATKNYKTTWGAMPYKDQQIDMDATVVQRLEAAGAVLVAKLTMGALAYGDIWFGGRTNNPWDISEGASGSSAGPGSATAAGLVGFSIGTETLGSIVSPSTRNGVTGLRPTYGRVSRYGAMALSWSMDKIGPMCRSVEDCALVFSAIYGADGQDLTLVNQDFAWQPEIDIQGLRVAYVPELFEPQSTDVSVGEALDEALIAFQQANEANSTAVLDVLRNTLNLDLGSINLPDYDLAPLFMIVLAEGAAAFDDLTRSNQDDLLKWQVAESFPNLFRSIRLMSAVEYIQANRVRTKIMQEMAAIMSDVDVLVVPSFGGNVLSLTNFTGHPAVVLPNGFTPKHTPTSITFIGGLYKEAETLAVARAYQNATDFHLQYPPMDYESLQG